jgi:hypothetical protein
MLLPVKVGAVVMFLFLMLLSGNVAAKHAYARAAYYAAFAILMCIVIIGM